MTDKFVSERNLKFLLYEVFDAESLTKYPYFEDHDREMFDMVLETALKMGRDMMRPCSAEMDQNAPELVEGVVKVHPMVRQYLRESGEGGWIGAGAPYELGGQQMPTTVKAACGFIFAAANYSLSVYPGLCSGSSHLIESFGSEELKETYIPKMFAGAWQGTMALTESQAGSSLSDIITSAEPTDQGYYKIKGEKVFISAGDHEGADNVVHLMLVKIKGAPPGAKGISLFVIPKYRIGEGGRLEPNDIICSGVYHKLGYRGCPLTQLTLGENDDCRGWLVGQPHKGLSYMFQMMNEERIEVGMSAAAIASAAYYASLEYAQERPQGRKIESKDPTTPQVLIIKHADVKRMLLFQRAVVEGALGILLQCGIYADLARVAEGEEKERNALLLDLLTPIAKNYPSEMGLHSCSQGLQILGGSGFTDEYPLEQHFRDARIHPIHEGTTGIQGLDILGRKVTMKGGRAFELYLDEVRQTIEEGLEDETLKPYAQRLEAALERLESITGFLLDFAAEGDVEVFLADATLYLEFFGLITIAWQWLKQGLAVQKGLAGDPSPGEVSFYQGKLFTMKFYFHYELPKIEGLAGRLMETDGLTVRMEEGYFDD